MVVTKHFIKTFQLFQIADHNILFEPHCLMEKAVVQLNTKRLEPLNGPIVLVWVVLIRDSVYLGLLV